MKLSEIQEMWLADAKIDRTELGEESLRIPTLHSKYYVMFSHERMALRQLEVELREMNRVKYEYYNGTLSEDELRTNGWEPFALKILKSDIPVYLQADVDLNKLGLRIEMQKEKVDFLESIIKNLPARGYQINAAISWEKFKVGA